MCFLSVSKAGPIPNLMMYQKDIVPGKNFDSVRESAIPFDWWKMDTSECSISALL